MDSRPPGTLFIISTPIGNLDDLSPRAIKTLQSTKHILCESISHTKKLFTLPDKMPLQAKLIFYHGKGPKSDWQIQQIITDLQNGDSISLVSNAGTPLISDPGIKLTAAVVRARLPIIHIPGPTAAISAAVTSGLPTNNLILMGFLSKKQFAITATLKRAQAALSALKDPSSLVVYCSKYQLSRTLDCIQEVFGSSVRVSIARELTKKFEEHFTGSVIETKSWLNQSSRRQLGEFTLVISPF